MRDAPAGARPGEAAAPYIAQRAWMFLLVAALACGLYFHAQYRADNAAPELDISSYRRDPPESLAASTEHCHWTARKISVVGWIARRGVGAGVRRVRAVVVDPAGRAVAMKTSLRDREDVSTRLNQRFGDRTRYRNAGFSASLSLSVAGPMPRDARVFLAYDDGQLRALVPLACSAGSAS